MKKKNNTKNSSVLCSLMQGSWVQVTRQPRGIMACWTRFRLCVGPVRTLQPLVATRYVSLCSAQGPELPVSTCSRCLTTRRATAGATPPKVKFTSHWGTDVGSSCIFKYACSMCTSVVCDHVRSWCRGNSTQFSSASSFVLMEELPFLHFMNYNTQLW